MKLDKMVKWLAVGLVTLGVLLVGWALYRHNSQGKITSPKSGPQVNKKPYNNAK
jgi:hypothetical protein